MIQRRIRFIWVRYNMYTSVQMFHVKLLLLVMEYLSGGPVEWCNTEHKPILLLQQIRRIVRDTLLGLEYRA